MVVVKEEEDSADSTASNRTFAADSTTGSLFHSISAVSPEEEQVRLLCKQKLNKRLFVGEYLERRYVEQICAYRDVIEIHKSEFDLKKDLDTIKGRLQSLSVFPWIGITGPGLVGSPTSHAVWVKLHDVCFGQYWFQIRQVKFGEREVLLLLKVVRPLDIFTAEPSESATHKQKATETTRQPPNKDSQQTTATPQEESYKDWSDTLPTLEEGADALKNWAKLVLQGLIPLVTFHNIKEVFRFVAAFLVAAVAGLVESVRFTGDFSIKFMREISLFVRASTPIVLGVIDFFTKMVGGLYILLAMMWRGSGPQPPPRPPYQTSYPRPALTMGSQFSSSTDRSYRRHPEQRTEHR